ARISIRDEPSISLPPREEIPSTPPNSPTHIEILKSCLPLRKRVHFASPTPSREREDLYGFVNMVDVPPRCSTSRELDYGITDTWDDLVGAIDEIAPTTVEGVNLRLTDLATIVEEETTIMDRPIHTRLAMMVEREAKMDCEAWGLSMDSSNNAHSDVMSLHHRRQVQLIKTLRLLKGLQTQMIEFHRQHGPAKGPSQPDARGEAGSSS
ncbi:hypothetical protein Tco_1141361, partial [Tanacetum coccineum]